MSTITLTVTTATVTASPARGTQPAEPASLTASVTNSATVPARVVLGAFPPLPGPSAPASAAAWTVVERPLRDVAAGATEPYTVTVAPPPDTAAGDYVVRLIAYDADRAPEEYSDQARQLQATVPAGRVDPGPRMPWWIYAVAGALVLIVAVVAFVVLRPGPEPPLPPPPPPTPTATPTAQNPCPAPFVPRNSRPGDLTCVMPASAEEAQFDNRADIQRNRVIPGTDPVICAIPYEPRLAFPDDFVCVWEDTANRTHIENQPGYTERMFNDKEYPETFSPRP